MMQELTISTEKFPSLAYKKAGNGPVLMLIHGFPANGDLWGEVTSPLAEHFTLIVPDLPGAGKSTFAGEGLTVEDMAGALKAILDAEGINKSILAGHSMGGYTAMAFAELFPERLSGLSMVHSLASADTEEKKDTRRKSIELIRKGGKEPFIKQMIPNLFSSSFKEQRPEELKEQVAKGLKLEADSMVAFYNAMIQRPDRIRILYEIKCPVQWIAGKEDTIATPEKVIEQGKLSQTGFISVYENCAHMSMVEQPGRLVDDLKSFGAHCAGIN